MLGLSATATHGERRMSTRPLTGERGPFRAEHLREGDRYELSNGHAIYCNPAGREHAGRNLTGAAVTRQ